MSRKFYAQLQADMAEVIEQYRDAPTKVDDKVFEEEIDWYCRDNKELAKPMKAWFNQTLNALDQHEDPPELPVPEDMRLPKDELPKASHGPILAKVLADLRMGTVEMNGSSQEPANHHNTPKDGSPVARKRLPQTASKGVKRPPQAKVKDDSPSLGSDGSSATSATPMYNSAATMVPELGIRLGFCRQLPIEDSDEFTYWIEKKNIEAGEEPDHWPRTVTNYRFEDGSENIVSIAMGEVPDDEELYLVGLAGPIGVGWEPSERLMAGHWAQNAASHASCPVEVYWIKARIREITSSAFDFFRGGRTKVLAAWSDTSVYIMQACSVNFARRFQGCKVTPKTFSDVPVTRNSLAPKWMSQEVFKRLQDEYEAAKQSPKEARLRVRDRVPVQPGCIQQLWNLEGELVRARWQVEQSRQQVAGVTRSQLGGSKDRQKSASINVQGQLASARLTHSQVQAKIKKLKDAGLEPPVRYSSPENQCYYDALARQASPVESSVSTGNGSAKRRKLKNSPSTVADDDDVAMDAASTADADGEQDTVEDLIHSPHARPSGVGMNLSAMQDLGSPLSSLEPEKNERGDDDMITATHDAQIQDLADHLASSSAPAPTPPWGMGMVFGGKHLTTRGRAP